METMSDAKRRKEVLKGVRLSRAWPAEPLLGSAYGEEEIEAAVKAIRDSMDPVVGFGFDCEEIEQFEAAFADYCDTKHAVAVNGAGTGIDMSIAALELAPGEEVICPAINFRAVPMAIIGQRGTPVLCEVDPATLQMDPEDVEKKITPHTRAIYPTHMNGLSAPMDELLDIAQRHPHPRHGPLKVIGDGARALGGGYKGRKIGKAGWMNVFSLHTQKNITTLGEGGMVVTDDSGVVPRLRGFRQFGGADRWGSNYKMTKVQAAVGLVQLGRLDGFIAARRKIAQERTRLLAGCPGIQLPCEPDGCVHSYYLYSIMVCPEWAGEIRNRLMGTLLDDYGVDTVVANPPVHESYPFVRERAKGLELPISHDVGQRLFCPPIHPCMSAQDNEYIAAAIWEAATRIHSDTPASVNA